MNEMRTRSHTTIIVINININIVKTAIKIPRKDNWSLRKSVSAFSAFLNGNASGILGLIFVDEMSILVEIYVDKCKGDTIHRPVAGKLKQISVHPLNFLAAADFDDLETTVEESSVLNYTKAGNIANYLQILEVEHMYLLVPVNFIFIGFEWSGNQVFKLHTYELERWFKKIDHIFEHTRIPQDVDVLAPFYKNRVDRDHHHHHLPLLSHLNYNFSVHAIQMGEKVNSIFDHAIAVLSRKDDVNHTRRGLSESEIIFLKQIEWYNSCLNDLNNVERQYQEKDVADIIQSKVIQDPPGTGKTQKILGLLSAILHTN
ncbi:unnamed protein product [Lactuca virosa]|uniref:DNA2/NAM7 helicase helicase domain-containing protein n=1 Tax=Lactuca virosa TaxID=75947 RepID=A0AAU9NSI1_9ASTR|nr:unnamed protein product [Lactuca virosa]